MEFHSLLNVLLRHLRRARETPLQFGIDGDAIVAAALAEFRADGKEEPLAQWRSWIPVTQLLDRFVDRLLRPEGGNEISATPIVWAGTWSERLEKPVESNQRHPLAMWLERLHDACSQAQSRAVEIVAWRAEGFDDRDIAERLELGLRMVKQIIADARRNWAAAMEVAPAKTG